MENKSETQNDKFMNILCSNLEQIIKERPKDPVSTFATR